MEWNGTFEVPDSGVRVGGRLIINDIDSSLTTYGQLLSEPPDGPRDILLGSASPEKLPMVWCVSEDGERLTLLELISLGQNVSWPGDWTTRQRWICRAAVEGHLDPGEADTRETFSSFLYGLSDLSAWLSPPLPEWELGLDESERFGPTVDRMEPIEVDLGEASLSLAGALSNEQGFDEYTIRHSATVLGTPSEEMPWDELVNKLAVPMEVLLWVATGRYSELDPIRVQVDHVRVDAKYREEPHKYHTYARLWASMLRPRNFEPPKRRLIPSEMLFTAADMPGGAATAIVRWHDRWEQLKPAIRPVIARVRAPFAYSNDDFMSVVAALESYSTLKHGERDLSKDERNRRVAIVEEALGTAEPGIREWVTGALDRAHYHTLRSRLKRLLEEAGPVGTMVAGLDSDTFITPIISARDSQAHSTSIVGGLEGGEAMYWTSQGLLWLLRYHMLVEIGYSVDEAQRRIQSNRAFERDTTQLHEILNLL